MPNKIQTVYYLTIVREVGCKKDECRTTLLLPVEKKGKIWIFVII